MPMKTSPMIPMTTNKFYKQKGYITMKKSLLFGIAALCLAPFELTKKENGDFSYKSVLLGVEKKQKEDGSADLEISFFNKPTAPKYDICKCACTEDDECDCECDCEEDAECDCDCADDTCADAE